MAVKLFGSRSSHRGLGYFVSTLSLQCASRVAGSLMHLLMFMELFLGGTTIYYMDAFMQPGSVFAFTAWLLLQLLHEPLCSNFIPMGPEAEEDSEDPFAGVVGTLMGPQHDSHALFTAGLHNYRLCTMFQMFDEDLGYWVRPRSTTWFSRFLLKQYNDHCWIQMFRMSKKPVFALADILKPHVQRQDTRYRIAIPVLIRVAYTLFKLTHGASLIICSKVFAI